MSSNIFNHSDAKELISLLTACLVKKKEDITSKKPSKLKQFSHVFYQNIGITSISKEQLDQYKKQ